MSEFLFHRSLQEKEIERIRPTSSAGQPVRHLNQIELSRRWSMSPRTLERWRWLGEGPPYLKIGGKILYRLEDIENFEARVFRKTKHSNRLESLI